MKVLISAKEIPVGSTVIKKTGSYEYTILDEIQIYQDGDKKTIPAQGGARFLTNGDGAFSAVDGSLELLWVVEEEELIQFLEERSEERFD